ncbi:MAG TPA: heme exporter protein CcmD [Acidimicrobiia bacterium]|jgi:heme exporter protein CcmD|nr:heme exporter protein CcmD [Acidimicrobiia bacterium]
MIEHAWGYVGTGYALTAVVLAGYVGWMARRRRRLEQSLSGDGDG